MRNADLGNVLHSDDDDDDDDDHDDMAVVSAASQSRPIQSGPPVKAAPIVIKMQPTALSARPADMASEDGKATNVDQTASMFVPSFVLRGAMKSVPLFLVTRIPTGLSRRGIPM